VRLPLLLLPPLLLLLLLLPPPPPRPNVQSATAQSWALV
jgi:hypothetical protein